MILLLLFLLALPCFAQEYPPVLIDVLGYDVLRHHFQKEERPVFSLLGGGKRSLMTVRLVEVPDSTQRATVELPDGSRRVVRVELSATRCYDLRGARLALDRLGKGKSCILAYYEAAEPVVTEVLCLEGDPGLGAVPESRPRTLPVTLGGVTICPPQGWQKGAYEDLTPRVYHGKLRPHLFVSHSSSDLGLKGLTEVASVEGDHLALWTFEDKVLAVRLRSLDDGVVVALFCLLEDYQAWVPGYLEAVGNLERTGAP